MNIGVSKHRMQWKISADAWLRRLPWQVIAHLTFPFAVRRDDALSHFFAYQKTLDCTFRTPVAHLYGLERESNKGLGTVGWHFHAVFAARKPLDGELMKTLWKREMGRSASDLNAVINDYDPAMSGAAYCVKFNDEGLNEWDVNRWVNLFAPGAERQNNHHRNRTDRRHPAVTGGRVAA